MAKDLSELKAQLLAAKSALDAVFEATKLEMGAVGELAVSRAQQLGYVVDSFGCNNEFGINTFLMRVELREDKVTGAGIKAKKLAKLIREIDEAIGGDHDLYVSLEKDALLFVIKFDV